MPFRWGGLKGEDISEIEFRPPTMDDLIAVGDPLVRGEELITKSWLKLCKLCMVNVSEPFKGKVPLADTGAMIEVMMVYAFPQKDAGEVEDGEAGKSVSA